MYVKHTEIMANNPTFDGVNFNCHNRVSLFNFARKLTMLYFVSIHEVKNPLNEVVFERGLVMNAGYFLAMCSRHGLDNVEVYTCTSLEACVHMQNSL